MAKQQRAVWHDLNGVLSTAQARTDYDLVALAARTDLPFGELRPGALELLMLAARREGRISKDGVLFSLKMHPEAPGQGLATLPGVAEMEEHFATATTLCREADRIEGQHPRSPAARDARKKANRAQKTADDHLLNVAFLGWREESERTGSPHDRAEFDRLQLRIRERSRDLRELREMGRRGGTQGKGVAKRGYTRLVYQCCAWIEAQGGTVSFRGVCDLLDDDDLRRPVTNGSIGDPIVDLVDCSVDNQGNLWCSYLSGDVSVKARALAATVTRYLKRKEPQ